MVHGEGSTTQVTKVLSDPARLQLLPLPSRPWGLAFLLRQAMPEVLEVGAPRPFRYDEIPTHLGAPSFRGQYGRAPPLLGRPGVRVDSFSRQTPVPFLLPCLQRRCAQ